MPIPSAFDKAIDELRHSPGAFPNVSARWLVGALVVVLLAVAACAWLALCLLYWQGSWQLLYHPKSAIVRTPASVGLNYEPIRFAATETGQTQLTGWWIPSADAKLTVLYLHGADGNLSDSVDPLAALRRQNLSVFAVDYRGYGASQPIREAGHPSEKQLLQDSQWALDWLTQIRHISPSNILLYGSGLGADLAAEVAAQHSELAGVILDNPLENPLQQIFSDRRSKLVPAHWLVKDSYDLRAAASHFAIPSLWIMADAKRGAETRNPDAYEAVLLKRTGLWLKTPAISDPKYAESLQRWLDDLQTAPQPIPAMRPLTR